MTSAAILLPPLLLLFLPLIVSRLLFRRQVRRRGPARGRPARVRRATASFALGVLLTLAVLSPLVLVPAWCRTAPRGRPEDADVMVAFAFGLGPTTDGQPTAGGSNRAIADWLVANNPGRKPVIAQDGVARALTELAAERPGALAGWTVVALPSHEGVYVDTTGGAFQTDAVLSERGWARPLFVGHDLHLQRVVWAFAEAGIGNGTIPDMPPVPFDRDSTQHLGTRYRTAWLAREYFLARPVTLRPQLLTVLVGVAACWYGAAMYRVWRHYNPVPVVTILLPVGPGLLLVRRRIRPAAGQLMLPGGYVDESEPWQQAAARELLEETGLRVPPQEFEPFHVRSTRRGHLVVIYALARPHAPPPGFAFAGTAEVSELRVLTRPIAFAWAEDTDAVGRYFSGHTPAQPGTPDTLPFPG